MSQLKGKSYCINESKQLLSLDIFLFVLNHLCFLLITRLFVLTCLINFMVKAIEDEICLTFQLFDNKKGRKDHVAVKIGDPASR